MPVIQFHGLLHVDVEYLRKQRIKGRKFDPQFTSSFAHEVAEKAKDVLVESEYANEVEFEEFIGPCTDVEGRPTPYIRICDTDMDRAKRIYRYLSAELLVTIDILQLAYFEEARESFDE